MRSSSAPSLFAIDDFAAAYVREMDDPAVISEEDLADAFRQYFNLSLFPSLNELVAVCKRLHITLRRLPPEVPLTGLNTWHPEHGHEIHLRDDGVLARLEHTLSHELREVIEQALGRAWGRYIAIDTSDNRLMNPRSDRFAACLLLDSVATRGRLAQLGFDLVAFAQEKGRSLSSVVLRAQEIYPAKQPPGIVGGVWLFQANWQPTSEDPVCLTDLRLRYKAHLCGFSLSKSSRRPADRVAREIFPRGDCSADQFEVAARAWLLRKPAIAAIGGFDLFSAHNFIALAEPIMTRGIMRSLLMIAVRREFQRRIEPLLSRLGLEAGPEFFQRS